MAQSKHRKGWIFTPTNNDKKKVMGVDVKRYPRNKICFCGSNIKYKNCHFKLLHPSQL